MAETFGGSLARVKIRQKMSIIAILVFAFLVGEYSGRIVPLSPCPTYCRCEQKSDGLATASCSEISIERSFPNIQSLTLKPSRPGERCFIPNGLRDIFPQLSQIVITNCSIGHLPVAAFKGLTSLQEVDISSNNVRTINPFLFSNNPRLRYVNMENNRIHVSPNRSFLTSKSIAEINLSSCNLSDIPVAMFKGLPNLRHLTLNDNQLKTLNPYSLPNAIKTLSLARNEIVNVPIGELLRVKHLMEINLSNNPINCTCELMGFQNWVSGNGVIFLNNIECSLPIQFSGQRLINIPQYELCEAMIERDFPDSSGNDNIISPIYDADGFQGDQPLTKLETSLEEESDSLFKHDEVMPVFKKTDKRSQDQSEEQDESGSGEKPLEKEEGNPQLADTEDTSGYIVEDNDAYTMKPSEIDGTKSAENQGKEGFKNQTDQIGLNSKPTKGLDVKEDIQPISPDDDDDDVDDEEEGDKTLIDTEDQSKPVKIPIPINTKPPNNTEDEVVYKETDDLSEGIKIPKPEEASEKQEVVTPQQQQPPIENTTTKEEDDKTEEHTEKHDEQESEKKEEVTSKYDDKTKKPEEEVSEEHDGERVTTKEGKESETENPKETTDKHEESEGQKEGTQKPSETSSTESPPETSSTDKIPESSSTENPPETSSTENPPETSSTENPPETSSTEKLPATSSMPDTDAVPTVSEVSSSEASTEPYNHTSALSIEHPESKEIHASIWDTFNLNYVVPCVILLLIIILLLAVYVSHRRRIYHKEWSPENGTNNDGQELQDVSLLSDSVKGNIVKHTNKYPDEVPSEQTVSLMGDQPDEIEPKSSGGPREKAFIKNGEPKGGVLETVDDEQSKTPNGQTSPKSLPKRDNNEIELTKAKVTTLPDSIPRIPIIVNKSTGEIQEKTN